MSVGLVPAEDLLRFKGSLESFMQQEGACVRERASLSAAGLECQEESQLAGSPPLLAPEAACSSGELPHPACSALSLASEGDAGPCSVHFLCSSGAPLMERSLVLEFCEPCF